MIFSENRCPLFRIMLELEPRPQPGRPTRIVTSGIRMSDSLPMTPAASAAHLIRHAATSDYRAVRRLFCIIQDDHAARLPELFRPFDDGDFSVEYFERLRG